MARLLKEFPDTGRYASYPWDEWLFDGAVWELQQGVDFRCRLDSMQTRIKDQARKRGLLSKSITNKEKRTIVFMCWAPQKENRRDEIVTDDPALNVASGDHE